MIAAFGRLAGVMGCALARFEFSVPAPAAAHSHIDDDSPPMTARGSTPGPGPLLAAATAWDELSAQLLSTAAGYAGVVAELTGVSWPAPG